MPSRSSDSRRSWGVSSVRTLIAEGMPTACPYDAVMSPTMVELIGYAGSVLVVLSFTMRRIIPLRLVSVGGAIVTSVYGLLIHAWPVFITNLIIVGIHALSLIHISEPTRRTPISY